MSHCKYFRFTLLSCLSRIKASFFVLSFSRQTSFQGPFPFVYLLRPLLCSKSLFYRILRVSFVKDIFLLRIDDVDIVFFHNQKKRPFEALSVSPEARGLEPVSPQAR